MNLQDTLQSLHASGETITTNMMHPDLIIAKAGDQPKFFRKRSLSALSFIKPFASI